MLRVAVALTALLVVTGCGTAKEPRRDASGRITEAGTVRADHLRVGDCYDDQGKDAVAGFPVVPCVRPHDNEVFFLFDAKGNGYPGQDALTEQAITRCGGPAFTDYVGVAAEDSSRNVYEVLPTKDTWEHYHDRQIVCSLFARDRSKLTGSVKDSAE